MPTCWPYMHKESHPTQEHTAHMTYKGGGELGCEGLQFVGGINFVKGFVKGGCFICK